MQMHHPKRCPFSLHGYLLYIEQALRLILESVEEKKMEIALKENLLSHLGAIMTGQSKLYTRTWVECGGQTEIRAAECRMQNAGCLEKD